MPQKTLLMPQPNTSITRPILLDLTFLGIFILALFPGVLHFLLKLPLYPFGLVVFPSTSPTPPPALSPTCPSGCVPVPSGLAMSTSSSWFQRTITLPAKSRGSYLITDTVVSQLPEIVSSPSALHSVVLSSKFHGVGLTLLAFSDVDDWNESR
jgi:hypothetical protein